MKPERRILDAEIRTADTGEDVTITGTAAVFNQNSENLGGFVERIDPGFFRTVLLGDTVALFNHDDNFVMGRTGAGTLTLSETRDGLEIHNRAAKTTRNEEWVFSPMRRQEVRQMSFAFKVGRGGDRWEEMGDGLMLRTLLAGGCEELYDVSYVTRPAYPQTDAALRSLHAWSGDFGKAALLSRAQAMLLRNRVSEIKGAFS